MQEFNLVQNNLAAEYGRTSGMVVNVVLKSGTNNLHGSVYGTNRNSVFSASNPFARRDAEGTPLLKPWSNWNNFGGTFGGPVYIPGVYDGRNRTFFFVSAEMSFLHAKQNKILTVPLPNEKRGDFRGDPRYTDTCDVVNNPGQCIYDPATTEGSAGSYTRQPFATPVIPENRIDPLAKISHLDSIPNPNFVDPLSTCGIYCNNYIGQGKQHDYPQFFGEGGPTISTIRTGFLSAGYSIQATTPTSIIHGTVQPPPPTRAFRAPTPMTPAISWPSLGGHPPCLRL